MGLIPNMLVAVDLILFAVDQSDYTVKIYLQKRPENKNVFALPGVLLTPDETYEQAVNRIIKTKTNLLKMPSRLTQLPTRLEPGRDSRSRVISLPTIAFINTPSLLASDWFAINHLPKGFAFDHQQMIEDAKAYLTRNLLTSHLPLVMLGKQTTIPIIKQLYANFKPKFKDMTASNFKKVANLDKVLMLDLTADNLSTVNKATTAGRRAQIYNINLKEIL